MATSEILENVLSELGLSMQDFATSIGYPVSKLYDISRGRTKKFSEDLIAKISETYPKYTRSYLLLGENAEESMPEQESDSEQEVESPKPTSQATVSSNIDRILNELAAQRVMSNKFMGEAFDIIKHFQTQTDRMIAVLETYITNTK